MTEVIEILLYISNQNIVIGVFNFKVYIQILRDTYTSYFPFAVSFYYNRYTVLITAF